MTAFYPPDRSPPEGLLTAEFRLEPLHPRHAALDYEALMVSTGMLRAWSQSPWPADDFTLDENRADLQMHWDEHVAREAFTYTVLNPAGDRCRGCVYVKPLSVWLAYAGADAALAELGDYEGLVTFWAREPGLADDLDVRLLAALRAWFRETWAFRRVSYGANEGHRRHLDILADAGLERRYTLTTPKPHALVVWAEPTGENVHA